MLLRPPPLHQQQDNLSHVISQSDARQSSKSRNKIKKKQNSLSFRNKPLNSNKQSEEPEREDNGSVHSHASGRSKKSKKKQSSIGLNKPKGGHLLNSPRKSQQDDIEVMNYADVDEDKQTKIKSYDVQYSEVKRDYANNYSPNVYQNRSPNIQNKPSFKNVLNNFEYEKQPSFKQDQDDQIPVVKLVQAKGRNQITPKYNNMQNVISPKIAEKKQTRKLGQLFQQNRRNANELGVSAVPSQINGSSLVGESRRSRSKLGQLFKDKSRQKQISNNSRVSFTQNSSSNYQGSISDINLHLDSHVQGPATRSKEKLSVIKNNPPEKVLQESIHQFQAHNQSQLNLSMSKNSPMVSKHYPYSNSHDGNKDSVCFNIQPERQRRKKGLGLASKIAKDEDQMIKFSGDITSKQLQPKTQNNKYLNQNSPMPAYSKQQDAHERLKMNLKQNEKYLIDSGVMGINPQNQLKEQEERRKKQQQAKKKEQYLREIEAAQQRKRQQRILIQQKKEEQLRIQQENLRKQQQKKREDMIKLEAEKNREYERKQNQRRQLQRKQNERRRQQERKELQKKQKERKMEKERIERLKQQQQQNERIRLEQEQAERRRKQKQVQKEKLKQKQVEQQRKRNIQKQKQREEQKLRQIQQEKLRQQQQAKRQRQRLKNAYKSEQAKIKQNSQRSLVYDLENQSLNEPETNKKGKSNALEHIPSSYSLQQSSKDSSKSKQSRKSTRKKQGVIPSKTHKHVIGDASPRAEQSFYQSSHEQKEQKKSQPVQNLGISQAPRKLMSFQQSDDLTYEPKNQYKTDTYFYDKSSKAYSKPPLSKKSNSSKSKPKQSSINKKQVKDSQIKVAPVVQTKQAGQKKLSLVELAMKKNYEPESGSEYQSQDSFRSRQNSANSSGSRNSRNSAGSKKKQSTIKLKQNTLNNRPPLYRKTSSENQDSLMNRTAQHEKQMSSRQKYGDFVQRQHKPKVIKGCSFIDERGRLVQNADMIVRGNEVSGSMTKIGGLTQQKFAQKLMKSRDKRRSRSRERSLQRSRASSRSNEKRTSQYQSRGESQYVESEAYEQSQYSNRDRRYDTSGMNFYTNTRNEQSFYQNTVSKNNFPNKNQRTIPQNLQQFMKPIQQAGINQQKYQNPRNQYAYQRKQPQNPNKKRIMQRTQKPRGY